MDINKFKELEEYIIKHSEGDYNPYTNENVYAVSKNYEPIFYKEDEDGSVTLVYGFNKSQPKLLIFVLYTIEDNDLEFIYINSKENYKPFINNFFRSDFNIIEKLKLVNYLE